MLQIDWRSDFGYGDFITGLGYAHNASLKFDCEVNVNFHWNHGLDHKETQDDPETIIDRMWYVYGTMRPLDTVSVTVTTDSKPEYRFINNFDEYNPVHGVWFTNLELESTNVVVLWRSKYNTFFPGKHKDPISNQWDLIIDWLTAQGYDVREVTYRTPVKEVIELIRICKFGIGYDGMVHQIFKYMWKPLLVVCERFELNGLLVPQAALENNARDIFNNGIDYYLNKSRDNMERAKQFHQRYINEKRNYRYQMMYNKALYRK